MASGDDDKRFLQELASNELNDDVGDALVTDQEEICVEEEQHKYSGDTIASSTDPNNVLVLQETEDRTAGIACCQLINLDQEVEEEHYWRFPDLAVIKIMKFTKEQKTLLNSRLVCTQWNQIIQDTSDIMKKITFYVSDLQKFMDLPIVKQGKIKSIVIRDSLPPLYNFVDAISKNVSKVTFTLYEEQLSPILRLVLEKCVNLYELRFDECFGGFGFGLSKNVIEETKIGAAWKISILSVNMIGLKESDIAGLSALLPKLPVLNELAFIGDCCNAFYCCIGYVVDALCEYLRHDSTSLKKLSLKPIRDLHIYCKFQSNSSLGLLFVLCGKHGIRMEAMPYLDLKWLLKVDDQLLDSILHGPLRSPAKTDGFIYFDDGPQLTNVDRFNLLNTGELELQFNRNLVQGELSWFGNLQHGLDELILRTLLEDFQCVFPDGMRLVSNIELDAAFSAGLPSLQALSVFDNVFDSIRLVQLAQYFPNLKKLYMISCKITPDNLISELTALQSLSELQLRYLNNLADVGFTMDCIDRNTTASASAVEDVGPSLAPAIACFKSLKYLQLKDCKLLTNACVINGIAKSSTLEKVVILYCKGISKQVISDSVKSKLIYIKELGEEWNLGDCMYRLP